MKRAVTACLLLCCAATAVGQGEQPAVDTRAVKAAAPEAELGTTIIGEEESAIGLYIMPWKEESPSDLDRPPALYTPAVETAPASAVQRQTEFYEAHAAYRREQLQRVR